MGRIAFIDIDGVIANTEARFKEATTDGKINWKIAFDPTLVTLDILIDGCVECMDTLEDQGYDIIFLSSRPEPMRYATEQWLDAQGIHLRDRKMVLKPLSAQYVKTMTWKALTVDTLASFLEASEVLFIDDGAENVYAVEEKQEAKGYSLKTYMSLAEAVGENA